ncbi:MAG TPA: hypothetical protein VHX38_26415 [Pseudonocardiaceae bacterium]|nr:hypothetical protein [Pseudonocardiaceae bacterium]
MAEFVRSLREIAATRPQQFLFAITDQRGQWMDTLTARNLDPALFGYQKQMNHSEGGVAELFNFPSTDKFIDFLIELTVDTAQPDLVAANLRKVVEVLGRKPDLLVDRDFCAEMVGRLDVLADRHDQATQAAQEATDARQAAARLAGAFRTEASDRESDKAWFAGEEHRLRADALHLDRERSRANDAASELLRIAANYRHAAAVAANEAAVSAAEQARDEEQAWEAVVPLAEWMEAQHEAEAVRELMAEQERETAPLRADRDDAAAALKARYAVLAGEERAAEQREMQAAAHAKASATAELSKQQQNREQATEARIRAENLQGELIKIDNELEAAVVRGDLPDAEAVPAVVLAESRTAQRETTEQRDAVRHRREARPAVRKSLSEKRRKLAQDKAGRRAELDQLVDDRKKLVERADTLATDARLAELTQLDPGGRLDLWAEAGNLRAALTHAASAAESAIVDTRVDAADDDRALDGLRTDGFLPTTRDAQRAADVLVTAGVPARPGWELLRDLVAESEREHLLQNAHIAELAAGVVVADADVDTSRGAVAGHDWRSVAHVTVCTATQLQQALSQAAPHWSVVPSDPALFDPDAADNARTDRERRRTDQDRRIGELHEQADLDRALLRALGSLLTDCPAGHLNALEKMIGDCGDAIAEIDGADGQLREQIDELDAQDAQDTVAESELSATLTSLARKIERLTTLAAKTAELPELRRAIERFEKDFALYDSVAKEAEARWNGYQELEQGARERAGEHKANRERYERDDRAIALLDLDRQPAVAGTGEPLSELQTRFSRLDSQWATVAAQSVLAERLQAFVENGRRAGKILHNYPASIRDRAAVLLATGDGQDPERRASARARSREAADRAQGAKSRTEFEVEEAQKEVDSRKPKDRVRYAQLDVEPATEAEARELADAEAATATEKSGRVTNLNREADEARASANDADKAAVLSAQLANRLRDAAAPVTVPEGVAAYSGTDAEADLAAVLDRLKSAVDLATSTSHRAEDAVREVRRLASENRFAGIPDAIRDRFAGDDSDVLGTKAAARADEMRVRRKTIEGQLADIGRDQRLVVVEIAALVRDVLANLDSAHRHSKLPGSLGGWGNEHFLRIRFVRPTSDEDLQSRIDAVVDRIVAEKSKPEGLTLLKRCVHEAVAPRGFTVKVLKPNSDLAVEPVDVTMLGKFSGGEKLTVCVALYCTLARLRAINRGRGRGALGGTLVLDNPLGTASHVALLRLQRDVAAAHGVRLVYTTGVEDLGAVGQFPNVLRMRNAPGALRTRRYVVLEDRFGSAVDGITAARVMRDETANGHAP